MENYGWIVRMKEYMNETAKNEKSIAEYIRNNKDNSKYKDSSSYGEFGRIQFIPVSCWNTYHEKFLVSHWIGQQQTVMLFNIEEQNPDDDIASYILSDRKHTGEGRFNALTMLHMSNEVKETEEEFDDILKKVREAIRGFISLYKKKNNKDILAYEVYGTFSSSEIAIIWSVSQYVDVINILDCLRFLHYEDNGEIKRVFIASYTIVARNTHYTGEYSDVRGDALVQLEYSTDSMIAKNEKNFDYSNRDMMKRGLGISPDSAGKIMSSVGKYDFVVQVPFEEIYASQPRSELMGLTTVTLVRGEAEEEWWKRARENEAKLRVELKCGKVRERQSSELWEHKKTYDDICRKIKLYDVCSEFRELLSLMFSDYKKVISSSVDQKWLEDYEEQFGAVTSIIKADVEKVVDTIEKGRKAVSIKKLTKRSADMGDIMQQQVDHILESSKLFFMSPNSNIGYTAQFDLMLHMYYGMIKTLIKNAYSFRNNSWQYPLVPIVTFVNIPAIKSNMFYTVDNSLGSRRLIQFELPCAAWASPLFYMPYLIHEVYHYVTPYDRGHRNQSFLRVVLTEVCSQYLKLCGEKYSSDEDKECFNSLRTLIKVEIYRRIAAQSEDILLNVEKCSKYCENTFRYNKETISDMPIYQLQEALLEWWKYTGSTQEPTLCRWIQEAIANTVQKGSSEYNLDGQEKAFLKKLEKDIEGAGMKEQLLGDIFRRIVNEMIHYMKEIYPDYAMIKQLGMGVSEYLVQIAVQQSSMVITPEAAVQEMNMIGPFRIVPIIEFLRKDKEFGEYRDLKEFKESFCALYSNVIRAICPSAPSLDSPEETEKEDGLRLKRAEAENENRHYHELAEEWFKLFEGYYREYMDEYTVFGQEFKEQLQNYDYDMSTIPEIYDIYQKCLELMRGQDVESEPVKQKLFKLQLGLTLKMQKQVSISELNQYIRLGRQKSREPFRSVSVHIKEKIENDYEDLTSYKLWDGFGGIMRLMHKIVNALNEYHIEIFGRPLGHEDLWYRGICNEKYHILPSVYRKYVEKVNGVKYDADKNQVNISLEQLQHHLLQHFRYQADGAPEILNQAVYQENDYLALMQHYQLPSNLLDWSEDVFAALYFAMEDYIKEAKDIEQGDPAVYFFAPAAYNRARKEMIQDVCMTCCRNDCPAYKNQALLLKEGRELVPNVSVQANQGILRDYFCNRYSEDGHSGYVHSCEESEILSEENRGSGCCEYCKLPVAYYCSRLSPRIRAQSGQFLAFSPNVHPYIKKQTEGEAKTYEQRLSFDYMALDEIQKQYLQGRAGRRPFLLKMVIPKEQCKELAGLLRLFGIKTMKYYPELTNLKD